MTRRAFAEQLEGTADHIADASRADLQVLLRRAALMLRNVGGLELDPKTDEPLSGLATEMGVSKPDLINTIVGDWLVANAYLPVSTLDEDSETAGSA
ncbi:hypothetical protein LB542_06485 [Mesorhizobium sp. BR1-1-9]|uniref:hypothetical protein n=1 Tax=Mesorhizobium sp. BR1-1-9 TaxID=2876646 RepID=UPI001CD15F60|nr:hypothetical protein [Mesorhizobium sp. BR1-1-9]MBZ9870502.1 hypothetical protein [Mesorhizobium sp. BR1-1-9]